MSTPEYDNLSQADRDAIDATMAFQRAIAGAMARLATHAQAMDGSYTAAGEAALAKLSGNNMIPNKSGYPGALEMRQDEVVAMVGKFRNLHTGITDIYVDAYWWAQYAKAAGPENMIG